jgi:flagellar hook-length control protein FliK
MTIAIVSALAKSPIRETPLESPAATGRQNTGEDFASILLALPVTEGEVVSAGEKEAARDPAIAEDSLVPADPQFLSTFGLPPLKPAGDAAAGEVKLPTQPVAGILLASTTGKIEKDPLQIKTETGDNRQAATSQTLSTAVKAANFAVPDVALPTSEQTAPGKTEPLSAANDPNVVATPQPSVVNGAAGSQDIPRDLKTPLRDPAWAGEFGQKLLWFAGNEKQFAQLTVHPPQLGSIEITLNIDKNGANAHFVSASAEVRGAIETAVPRLREMFTANGMDLGQVSVGSESFQQQSGGQQEPSRRPRLLTDNGILRVDSAGGLPNHAAAARGGHGLIDTFA